MRGMDGQVTEPLGVSPGGSLMRDVTRLVKAPSRIPRQYKSGDYYSNVNTKWITTNEGGSLPNGYFPRVENAGNPSGVTIAAGFDLGKHSVAGLRRLGLSEDLIKRLSPYLGLTGQAARDALEKQSVSIARDEVKQIDQAAFDSYFNSAGQAFDQAAGAGAFAKLPWRAQTVIADLWYNMGDLRGVKTKKGIKGGAPLFWRQVTTGDWEGAYGNLLNFTTVDRRLKERAKGNAKLVRDAIAIGTLPSE